MTSAPISSVLKCIFAIITLVKCKSPGREIKDSFEKVNQSLKKSDEITNNSIDGLYRYIDSHRLAYPDEAAKAALVYFTTKSTNKYIDSLQEVFESKDKTGENLNLATDFFIKGLNGDILLRKLSEVQINAQSAVFIDSNKIKLNHVLSDITQMQTDNNWKEKYFDRVPTIAALTILSKFQNDCANAATISLTDIKQRITK